MDKQDTNVAALDASIMRGIASASAGRVHELDDAAAKLDAKYAKIAAERRPQ